MLKEVQQKIRAAFHDCNQQEIVAPSCSFNQKEIQTALYNFSQQELNASCNCSQTQVQTSNPDIANQPQNLDIGDPLHSLAIDDSKCKM